MASKVVKHPMSLLLVSLCAQLRHKGNAVGQLGEQAAGALESLWRDNVRLTEFILETESMIKTTIDLSCEISKFGALRSARRGSDSTGEPTK